MTSPLRAWPDRSTVAAALHEWIRRERTLRPELVRFGVFGSFARGFGWGVGSDLDLVAVVTHADAPFVRRAADWPLEKLPVDADLLVYTRDEFDALVASGSRFGRVLRDETVWL